MIAPVTVSVTWLMAIIMPLALILMIGLLQPAKGAFIGLQWWFGMQGFSKERPGTIEDEAE